LVPRYMKAVKKNQSRAWLCSESPPCSRGAQVFADASVMGYAFPRPALRAIVGLFAWFLGRAWGVRAVRRVFGSGLSLACSGRLWARRAWAVLVVLGVFAWSLGSSGCSWDVGVVPGPFGSSLGFPWTVRVVSWVLGRPWAVRVVPGLLAFSLGRSCRSSLGCWGRP